MAEFDPTTARPETTGFDPSTAVPEAAPPARGFKGWAGDALGVAARGAISVPEAAVGLADIVSGGEVGKFLENEGGSFGFRPKQAKAAASEFFDSEATTAQNRQFQDASGIIDKAKVAIQNPSMIGRAVAESVPAMLAGGVASRGIQAATKVGPVLAGALGEGVVGAGSAAEQIRQETEDGRLTPTQAGLAAATGAATAGFGALGGKVASKLGIGDAETLLAQGAKGIAKADADAAARAAANPLVQQQAVKSIPRQVIEGAIAEGFLEELPQSVAEQVFQNLALGKDWLTDVDGAAVMGVLTGGAMGGGVAGYRAATRPAPATGADTQRQDSAISPGAQPPADGSAGLARVREAFAQQLTALQAQEQGEPAVPQTTPPDGAAVLAQQQTAEAARRQAAIEASRAVASPDDEIYQSTGASMPPSARMGLNPAAGPMSSAAALAVDTGVTDGLQQAAAADAQQQQDGEQARQAQAQAEQQAAGMEKAAAAGRKAAVEGQRRIDMTTGELLEPDTIQNWTDEQLANTFRGAQSKSVRLQMAQELSRRRAAALQRELADEQNAPEPTAPGLDAGFASVIEDAGPLTAEGNDGSTTPPNAGTQAAPARPAQSPAQAPAAGTGIADAGAAWTRTPTAEREAILARAEGLKPIQRKMLKRVAWADMNKDIQKSLAAAIAAPAASAVEAAAAEAAMSPANDLPEPTQAQREAGNYKKGHARVAGLDISIETPAGTRRRPEWPPLKDHYGYIKGTVGVDKDHVDVFLTDRAEDTSLPVFVVDQNKRDGSLDEHKVIMGAATEAEARETYLRNYAKGWTGLGGIAQMTQDEFKAWVSDPAKTKQRAAQAPATAGAIVEHVTGRGKTLRGVVRTDLTKEQAQAIDEYTFKKDGGWFIREKYLENQAPALTSKAPTATKNVAPPPAPKAAPRAEKSILAGKSVGDTLTAEDGSLYRILNVSADGALVRLARNPDQISEKVVLMGEDRYQRLLAENDAVISAAKAAPRPAPAPAPATVSGIKRGVVVTEIGRDGLSETERAAGKVPLTDRVTPTTQREALEALEAGKVLVKDPGTEFEQDVWIAEEGKGWVVKSREKGARATFTKGPVGPDRQWGWGKGDAARKAIEGMEFGASATPAAPASNTGPVTSLLTGAPDPKNSGSMESLEGFKPGDVVDVPGRTIGRSTIEAVFRQKMAGFGPEPMARLIAADGKRLDVAIAEIKRAEEPVAAPTPAKPKVNTAQARAKADLMAALADLGDILGKNTRMNIVPEQEQKLLPVLTRLLDAAFRLGYQKFKDSAKFALDQIRANLGDEAADALTLDHLQGAYIGMAGGKKGADTKRAVIDVETKAEIEAHEAQQVDDEPEASPAPAPAPVAEPAVAKPEGATLKAALASEVEAGRMPKDNPALKKLVEAYDGAPATPARMKEAQEALEAVIVERARAIVQKNRSEGPKTTFAALSRLYESQPLLNVRTSTSIENQAYSTPAPLAYLASRLAGIDANTTVLEPTAGNGMLLIGADPAKVIANELNPDRAAELRAQGFARVSEKDATERVTPLTVDAVITNPPFGSIKDADGKATKVKVDGYSLGQIDHLIAARALEAMKDDGRAVLILGANKVPGGISNDDLVFFNWLYSNYDVRGHFEADGKLYQRQGAGWPVRVITIAGRKASKNVSPASGTVPRVDTWEEVYDQYERSMAASGPVDPLAAESAGRANGIEAERLTAPQPVGLAPAAADRREPAGGATSNGVVPGASPRAVGNRGEREPAAVGAVAGQQRSVQPPAVAGRLDPERQRAGEPARAIAAGDPGNGGVADNEFQVAYVARSERKDAGVLIPRNMAEPTQAALNRLEDAVGSIDEFAAKELGYASTGELHNALMGLQIDSVASAIQQIKAGKGTIIADQTGIGKGRQAAAIIRWAVRNGKTPVFVTVKPSLFTDMFGDLADIGTDDVAPFIMNVDESIKGQGGERLFANKAPTHRRAIQQIAETGQLPDGRNAVFMTYSQINVPNAQRTAIEALAPNAVFILDESHNAGGDSATGAFIRGVLDQGQGVTYLSATYAKRPDNMPVYFKTDIGEAVADDATLMEAMSAGGLPLQTVVANNLVKAGQMFRRERSYDGVNIANVVDTPKRADHEKLSDAATSALREIVTADRMFHTIYVKERQKEAKEMGERMLDMAGNQASQSVNHTEFSSVVHNFVRQMLLGLKAQTAAEEAVASLKRGEKPLIAVENTMGSFLAEYAENNGIRPGAPLGNFDYRTVLSRALERTRYIVVQDSKGNKTKQYISLAELDGKTREAYDRAQEVIDGLQIDIPVSPIDWMRNHITTAGYSVAEITGRNLSVDYSGKRPVLSAIDQQEQRDKVETTRRFNDGRLDAVILNVAGSTGISLHASEKFADRRQRHMIVAQPAQDINIFMQMLGRIHRTGQVALPKYTILGVDLPAEKRPMALTADKMKSLNANTSSNTESATSVQAVSLLNKYGDQVVAQYLDSNLELARALGIDTPLDSEGNATEEDMARKATGRLALMPVKVQQDFYDEVEDQYRNLINYLNETNQNDLEPRTFDFDAKETSSQVLFEGENPATPFGEDAIYGEYSIKAQGRPMTPAEIKASIAEHLDGKTYQEHAKALIDRLDPELERYLQKLDDASREKALGQARATRQYIADHAIGAMFRVQVSEETYNAVVTNIRSTHKSNGNPYAASKLQITIALNGSLRSLTVPATQFKMIEVSAMGRSYSIESTFQQGLQSERETAKIITGNLLGAYGELKGVRGTIISFTKSDGTSDQGILLPKGFSVKANTQGDYRFRTGAEAYAFLMNSTNKDIGRFGISTRDQAVRVVPVGAAVTIRVPKSKARGAKFFLDKKLIEAAGADFVSTATTMNVTVPAERAARSLDVLADKQALYALPSMSAEAKAMADAAKPELPAEDFAAGRRNGAAGTPADRAVMGLAQAGAKAQDILGLIGNASRSLNNRRLAQALVKAGIEPKVKMGGDLGGRGDDFKYIAKYTHSSDTITMTQLAASNAEQVFLHEAVHAATVHALYKRGLAAIRMNRLFKHVEGTGAAAQQYGMTNVREFVAEAFSNPEFQAALKDMPAPRGSTLRTAWDEFVRIVRNFLGLTTDPTPGNSVLDEVMRAGAALMRENAAATGRGDPGAEISFAAAPPAESEAFKRWFGDSKVVDAEGKPLVVYHGTNAAFPNFNTYATANAVKARLGAYFTADHRVAAHYTGEDGGNVMPVYLRITNPFDIAGMKSLDAIKAMPISEDLKRELRSAFRAADAQQQYGILESMAGRGLREALEKAGYDGIRYTEAYSDAYIAFRPEQIKSATGNRGTFDPEDADISYFGAAEVRDVKDKGINYLNQVLTHEGKVSAWDKTVGTMRNLAERNPAFKPVFESAQQFIDDVAMLASDAADAGPRLMPRIDTLRDLAKKPVSAEDNAGVARPLFEGTLLWGRDVDGKAVRVDDLQAKYGSLPAAEKAQQLLRAGRIDPGVLRMWQGLPVEQFENLINSKFNSKMLKPGVLWSEKELKEIFGATDTQVSLYQEARKAIDRSLDMTTRADMLRVLGKDFADMRDVVLDAPTLADARDLLTNELQQQARENPEDADRLMDLNNAVVDRYEKIADLIAHGYAPLSRFGRYTVDVVAKDGKREYFGMFETPSEANKMADRMRREFKDATVTQGTMSEQSYKLFQGITPESLEMFGNMLGLNNGESEAQDKAFQAYLQLTKNNQSALKRLIHRKGIAGYSEDVGRVLANFTYSNARLGAGALNAGRMEQAIQGIPKEQGQLRDVAIGLREYISDPQEEGQAIRGMLFAQYLGGSLASAFVNTTQPFAVTMPWLSQFGGMRKAAGQLTRAMRDMSTKGFRYEADLSNSLHHAEADGIVSPQEIHQLMAQARGAGTLTSGDGTRLGNARAAASNTWERTKVLWGQPFALAEQFNRRSTFIAAYRLAKEQKLGDPAAFARKAVLETQFLYSKANKPLWARGAVGGTLLTFKTYSISYLELLNRTWNAGAPGSHQRAAGRRAVAWSMVMLMLMGGGGGLPFVEDLEDLIDGIGQLMGYNISAKQWRKKAIQDVVGKELGEFLDNGLSGLPGAPIDVSGRLGMGNLIPGTGLLLTKPSRERDVMELAGPAGDLVARGFTGARKLLTGDVGGAALEVSPTAVRNAAKGIDMATSGIYKDTKGYKVIDTTLDEALAKAIGFQPRSVAQVQESNSFMQRSKSFYTQTSAEIKAQWADALFNKDEAALERVRERLESWNRNNPEQPIIVKLPDVWKRVREMGKDRTQRIAETAPKAMRQQMREMANDS